MGYRRALVLRWSRRDRLAALVVALSVAFLVGTTLVVLAAGTQTAGMAAEFGSTGHVTHYDSLERALDLLLGLHREADSALVVVSHDPPVAERFTERLVLRDGRLVADPG